MSAHAPSYPPTFAADPQTTAHVTEAINFILAAKDCPSEHRPLIDYLVGLSGGSTDWFEAADEEVGLAARPSDEQPSRDGACKWVQRRRKSFLAWEKRKNVAFIECMPGGRDPVTKENFKSRYKVNLLELAEQTVSDAQELSAWRRDPRRALELAAQECADDTPITPPRKDRFRAPRRDDAALIQRNLKTIPTLALQLFEAEHREGQGRTRKAFAKALTRLILDRIPDAPPCAPSSRLSTLATKRVDNAEGNTGGAFRARCMLCGESYSGPHACADVWAATAPDPPENEQIGVDKFVHPPAEIAAVELYESVGAHEFGVTVKDETDGRCDYDVMTGDGLRASLPGLLERNRAGRESVIVRPMAERVCFWQVDDAPQETADLLRAVAFGTFETSPGSFQSWIAVGDELEKEELDAARARFLEVVKRTGGNGGSHGAVRWPGTLNRKHDPAPLVRTVHANPGRTVTIAELEEWGLLAPVPEEKPQAKSNVVPLNPGERPWPSYDKALAGAPAKQSGGADRSAADFSFALLSFLRGKGRAEVRARLLEVSESAREKTSHYLERTLNEAEKSARRG
jgi:hypothetical protein